MLDYKQNKDCKKLDFYTVLAYNTISMCEGTHLKYF
nr:MAG TPA: hypothetical protein [Bacteriophage sp.]